MFGLRTVQRAVLFPRWFLQQVPEALATPGLVRWWLPITRGSVEAWLLPGRGVSAERPGPAVIFAHGNGELIDYWPERLAPYRELGVSVVLFEYRGYGRSAGSPSEATTRADLETLHGMLRAEPTIDDSRLVYHGRSLGGGAVCTLVPRQPPRALVLESTFTSVVDVAKGMGVPSFLIDDRFDSLSAVKAYPGQVLVFHGTADELIPVAHGHRLSEASAHAQLVLYRAGHNDLPPAGADYWPQIEALLRRAGVL